MKYDFTAIEHKWQASWEKDKPYVYNRLYRLKERLKQSGSAHKTLYLTCLDR